MRKGYNGDKNCTIKGAVQIGSAINPVLDAKFWCRKSDRAVWGRSEINLEDVVIVCIEADPTWDMKE